MSAQDLDDELDGGRVEEEEEEEGEKEEEEEINADDDDLGQEKEGASSVGGGLVGSGLRGQLVYVAKELGAAAKAFARNSGLLGKGDGEEEEAEPTTLPAPTRYQVLVACAAGGWS